MSKTILVVDDEDILRAYMMELLKECGYEVIEAIDGQDGLQKFLEAKDEIAFIVTDFTMPQKNGMEMLQDIRKVRESIKAILASGDREADIVVNYGVLPGNTIYMCKPFKAYEFINKVKEILEE